jgi:uncharacterized protein with von Willebrand factor type A (vWA) domain
MNFFKALKKLITYLTEEEISVKYEQPLVQEEVKEKPPIEEEFIMEKTIENPYVSQVRDWAVKKIDLLHEADRHRNAKALAAEFDEWINIPEDTEELEYLSIENEEWTDEQEIDIR